MKNHIEKIKKKQSLTFEESKSAFEVLMDGKAQENEIFDFLTGLSSKGETVINLVIKNKNKYVHYSLKENRKFDLNQLKALKAMKYVEKITV